MAVPEIELVEVFSAPDPNTDEMITLLGGMFEDMLNQLPFPFSCGDAMSAALYVVVDGGLMNAPSHKQLREDIIAGLDRILAERAAEQAGRMN